jgi:hypothetical protein
LVVGGWWLGEDWVVFKIVLVLVLVLDPRPIACFAGGFVVGLIAERRQLVAGGREAIEALDRHRRSPLSRETLACNLRAFRVLRGESAARSIRRIPNPGYDPNEAG